MKWNYVFFWNSLVFSRIQWMLQIWFLVCRWMIMLSISILLFYTSPFHSWKSKDRDFFTFTFFFFKFCFNINSFATWSHTASPSGKKVKISMEQISFFLKHGVGFYSSSFSKKYTLVFFSQEKNSVCDGFLSVQFEIKTFVVGNFWPHDTNNNLQRAEALWEIEN